MTKNEKNQRRSEPPWEVCGKAYGPTRHSKKIVDTKSPKNQLKEQVINLIWSKFRNSSKRGSDVAAQRPKFWATRQQRRERTARFDGAHVGAIKLAMIFDDPEVQRPTANGGAPRRIWRLSGGGRDRRPAKWAAAARSSASRIGEGESVMRSSMRW